MAAVGEAGVLEAGAGVLAGTQLGIEEARMEVIGVEEILMDQDKVRTMFGGSVADFTRLEAVFLVMIANSRTICPRRYQITRLEPDLPNCLKRHQNSSLQRPPTTLGKDLSRYPQGRMTLTPYDQSGLELSKSSTGTIVIGSNSSREISMTMVFLVVYTLLLSSA